MKIKKKYPKLEKKYLINDLIKIRVHGLLKSKSCQELCQGKNNSKPMAVFKEMNKKDCLP